MSVKLRACVDGMSCQVMSQGAIRGRGSGERSGDAANCGATVGGVAVRAGAPTSAEEATADR